MGKAAICDPHALRAHGSDPEFGQEADRFSISGMRCGWGAGCLRPATQVWMRGKSFANALCWEHGDSLRLVLPQAQLVRWTAAEDRHWNDPRRTARAHLDR